MRKRRPKTEPEPEIELSPNELVAALKEHFDRAWSLDRLLDETEQQARDMVKWAGDEKGREQSRKDAETVLFWIESLRSKLEAPNVDAITLAFKAGALAEKMGFRPLEPYGKQGWRAKEALRDAARKNAHSAESISEALSLYDSLRKTAPGRKIALVEKEVERHTCIPPRTLRRHLKKRQEASAE